MGQRDADGWRCDSDRLSCFARPSTIRDVLDHPKDRESGGREQGRDGLPRYGEGDLGSPSDLRARMRHDLLGAKSHLQALGLEPYRGPRLSKRMRSIA